LWKILLYILEQDTINFGSKNKVKATGPRIK